MLTSHTECSLALGKEVTMPPRQHSQPFPFSYFDYFLIRPGISNSEYDSSCYISKYQISFPQVYIIMLNLSQWIRAALYWQSDTSEVCVPRGSLASHTIFSGQFGCQESGWQRYWRTPPGHWCAVALLETPSTPPPVSLDCEEESPPLIACRTFQAGLLKQCAKDRLSILLTSSQNEKFVVAQAMFTWGVTSRAEIQHRTHARTHARTHKIDQALVLIDFPCVPGWNSSCKHSL